MNVIDQMKPIKEIADSLPVAGRQAIYFYAQGMADAMKIQESEKNEADNECKGSC